MRLRHDKETNEFRFEVEYDNNAITKRGLISTIQRIAKLDDDENAMWDLFEDELKTLYGPEAWEELLRMLGK